MAFDGLWWFLMTFDDFWWLWCLISWIWLIQFLMMFDNIWWFLITFDDIWWRLTTFDDIWWCLMTFDDVWWLLMTLHNVRFGQFSLSLILGRNFIQQHMGFLIEIALFMSHCITKICKKVLAKTDFVHWWLINIDHSWLWWLLITLMSLPTLLLNVITLETDLPYCCNQTPVLLQNSNFILRCMGPCCNAYTPAT